MAITTAHCTSDRARKLPKCSGKPPARFRSHRRPTRKVSLNMAPQSMVDRDGASQSRTRPLYSARNFGPCLNIPSLWGGRICTSSVTMTLSDACDALDLGWVGTIRRLRSSLYSVRCIRRRRQGMLGPTIAQSPKRKTTMSRFWSTALLSAALMVPIAVAPIVLARARRRPPPVFASTEVWRKPRLATRPAPPMSRRSQQG